MSDLERFFKACEGEWVVERHELVEGRVKVTLRSRKFPDMTWSWIVSALEQVPPVGTVGRQTFAWRRN